MAEVRQTGGAKFRRAIREAREARGARGFRVGFFSTARYPDGLQVAAVAAWNELGARRGRPRAIPERPFFRQALHQLDPILARIIRRRIDPARLVVDQRLADELGVVSQGEVQASIVRLREPPNAPATVARKRSSNPLIDTGTMRTAVSYVVDP